ncbi:MAG: hypothetical protein ACTSQB_02265 [Candidatus Heimdallarchaeota archaeon]
MTQSEMEQELKEIEEEIEIDSLESRFNAFRRDYKNHALSMRILLLLVIIIGIVNIVLLVRILSSLGI